jgi:arylsulfatase A-like enzyme
VLITLDSTRADRIGIFGAKKTATPKLDALATDCLVFEHAYAQSPGTVVSHATILSGTYPQTTHATEFGAMLPAALPYVSDVLRSSGYRTGAFVGTIDLDPKNGNAPGFDRGFGTYDAGFHLAKRGETRYQSIERRGSQVAAKALGWIGAGKQPFFAWIELNDASAPHDAPYETEIAAADAAVDKVIAALRAQKLYDNTIVVIAADHGESLGSHGEDTHGIFLYDDTIHVPLLVKLPQAQLAGKRVGGKVRLIDVAPTILEVAGIPVPSQMQGQSLLRIAKTNPNADQAIYSRSDYPERAYGWAALESWRGGKYLYIRAPKPELYDMTADPGATKNLAQSSKGTLDTIAGQLDAFSRRLSDTGGKTGENNLSSSEVQKLASLGYVGLQKSGSGVSAASTGTDPKDVIASANKIESAVAALEGGQAAKAISALQPIVSAQSNLYLAQFALGVAYIEQKQFADAVKALHKAIELQADSAWAHYYMGKALLNTGDFKTAAVHLEIAASRLPEFADAHASLANAYEHVGRTDDANRERGKIPAAAKPKS